MIKIGVFGDKDYVKDSSVVQLMKSIYDRYGPSPTILSGGAQGPDQLVKKYALHYGMKFVEFNPSYTGFKMYSAENKNYYGKSFHISQEFDRYKKLIQSAEKVVLFGNYNNRPALKYAHGLLVKRKKDFVVIN